MSVQTISNLVIYTMTPHLTQRDFMMSGLVLTMISAILTLIVSKFI